MVLIKWPTVLQPGRPSSMRVSRQLGAAKSVKR
jgi:hypothetical protein